MNHGGRRRNERSNRSAVFAGCRTPIRPGAVDEQGPMSSPVFRDESMSPAPRRTSPAGVRWHFFRAAIGRCATQMVSAAAGQGPNEAILSLPFGRRPPPTRTPSSGCTSVPRPRALRQDPPTGCERAGATRLACRLRRRIGTILAVGGAHAGQIGGRDGADFSGR